MTAEPESKVGVSVLTSVVIEAEGARTCVDASELEATSRGVDRTRDRRASNSAQGGDRRAHPDEHADSLGLAHLHYGRREERDEDAAGYAVHETKSQLGSMYLS